MVASRRVEDDGFDCILIPDGLSRESPKVLQMRFCFMTGLSLISLVYSMLSYMCLL